MSVHHGAPCVTPGGNGESLNPEELVMEELTWAILLEVTAYISTDAHLSVKLWACLKEIKAWVTFSILILSKTEVIVNLGPKQFQNQTLTLDGITLASSNTV